MKISYNWLKKYIPISMEARPLADRLSLTGLEVEEVIERRVDFPNVVIGRVLSVEKHPDADKLSICQVTIGEEELSIICGAPNVARNQYVPVAVEGASLPNGLKIKRTKIRGVESQGMICSEAELGLADESEGIWVLPENLPLGVPLEKALDLENDFIYDLFVTPNRPDCLSHIGIAREVGAITRRKIDRPEPEFEETGERAGSVITISIEDPDGCPRYSARVIRNVKIGPSPPWMVKRLESIGIRSINNVVDITNYVLMETGHPLHAFDLNLISGSGIVVRAAREGEKFVTLDDKERTLKKGTVLICDTEKPVAIGGIMGGLNSEVNTDTRDILLESAYFNPERIQLSSRYLGLSTEASQRFERGADPNGTLYAVNRATQLIAEICQGEVCQGIVDAYPKKIREETVPLETDRINNLLGTSLSQKEITQILESIELTVRDQKVMVPTFRPDITTTADLAEEVARLYGLDNIPARQSFEIDYSIRINEYDLFIDQLKEILSGAGLQEVITSSMINSQKWEKMTGGSISRLMNPISKDLDGLRNSLVLSLAEVIQYNLNRQASDLKMFEINRIFLTPGDKNELPEENLRLAISLSGQRDGDSWNSSHQKVDFYDIKGLVELLCHKISLDNWQFISYSDSVFLQEDGLLLKAGNEEIGAFGRLNRKICEALEIEEEIYIADLSVDKLYEHRRIDKKYQPIPRFPLVERDLALIVDSDIHAGQLIQVMEKDGGNLLQEINIFDLYQGKQIPDGKKSLAFRLIFQSTERTLTEEEVNTLIHKIYTALNRQFDAELRA